MERDVKFILRVWLVFIWCVSRRILLKMELMKGNLFFFKELVNKFALFKIINAKNVVNYSILIYHHVYVNFNIILSVIDCIENLYQICGAGLHKIWFDLKQQ